MTNLLHFTKPHHLPKVSELWRTDISKHPLKVKRVIKKKGVIVEGQPSIVDQYLGFHRLIHRHFTKAERDEAPATQPVEEARVLLRDGTVLPTMYDHHELYPNADTEFTSPGDDRIWNERGECITEGFEFTCDIIYNHRLICDGE